MTRRDLLSGVALLGLAACGDDVVGPVASAVETEIHLELDWPQAREDWFVAYGWQLMGLDPDWTPRECEFNEPNCPGRQPVIVEQAGPFAPDGRARLHFTALCEPGNSYNWHVEAFGRTKSDGHGLNFAYSGCYADIPPTSCTEELQRMILSVPEGDDRCAVEEWAETDIDLRLDWSPAREPGFAGAMWTLLEREPDPDGYGARWVAVDGGTFSDEGVADVRFRTFCEPGPDSFLNYKIEVSGHYVAHEESFSDPECRLQAWNFACTSEPQEQTEFHPSDPFSGSPAQCTPPSGG